MKSISQLLKLNMNSKALGSEEYTHSHGRFKGLRNCDVPVNELYEYYDELLDKQIPITDKGLANKKVLLRNIKLYLTRKLKNEK